jgi:hypothetical protein
MPRKGTKLTPEQRAANAEYGRGYYWVMKVVPGFLDKKRACGRAAARKWYARVMADPAAADAYRAKKRAEYRARVLRQTALV